MSDNRNPTRNHKMASIKIIASVQHPQRLLLGYDIYSGFKFISIPLLRNPLRVVGWSNGLFCLHGYFPKIGVDTQRVVLWNPFLRKTVDIVIPYGSEKTFEFVIYNVVGFGVCPETSDVKLVIIDSSIPTHWVVKVFSLSSRAWTSVSVDPLFKSCELSWDQVSVNGFIYLLGYGDVGLDRGIRSNLIVSFDLKSETLGQVYLPDILLHTQYLGLSKRNECLTVLENSQTGI
ncbi:RNA-directed DNA polymerase, eukaryota, partial [Tanacetum coccineum]